MSRCLLPAACVCEMRYGGDALYRLIGQSDGTYTVPTSVGVRPTDSRAWGESPLCGAHGKGTVLKFGWKIPRGVV